MSTDTSLVEIRSGLSGRHLVNPLHVVCISSTSLGSNSTGAVVHLTSTSFTVALSPETVAGMLGWKVATPPPMSDVEETGWAPSVDRD